MEIKPIGISDININVRRLDIPNTNVFDVRTPPSAIPVAPPVVLNLGTPVVDLPGCVESNKERNPKNTSLLEDDERGTLTLCDSGVPSFNPIRFEPEQVIPTVPADLPKTDPPENPKPEIPTAPPIKPPQLNIPSIPQCPTREQELLNPIGKVLDGNKKIIDYELVNGRCIEVTEELNIPQQIITSLPNAGMVTTTASIAAVATTSALAAKPLADILLKVVKPAVKKVIKKVAAIRGKKPPTLSVRERRAEQRQMNHAVKALRSVFPRRKKKE
jgi:hypothetical protein